MDLERRKMICEAWDRHMVEAYEAMQAGRPYIVPAILDSPALTDATGEVDITQLEFVPERCVRDGEDSIRVMCEGIELEVLFADGTP